MVANVTLKSNEQRTDETNTLWKFRKDWACFEWQVDLRSGCGDGSASALKESIEKEGPLEERNWHRMHDLEILTVNPQVIFLNDSYLQVSHTAHASAGHS